MKRPHASDDVRERALAAIDEGRSVVDVAAFFQNDPSTLRRWIRQRTRTGSGLSRPRPGPRRLIPAEREADLQAVLRDHADATLAELCALWLKRHMVAVSVSTMGRTVRRLGITLKKSR